MAAKPVHPAEDGAGRAERVLGRGLAPESLHGAQRCGQRGYTLGRGLVGSRKAQRGLEMSPQLDRPGPRLADQRFLIAISQRPRPAPPVEVGIEDYAHVVLP
jgi:hypothetical protein